MKLTARDKRRIKNLAAEMIELKPEIVNLMSAIAKRNGLNRYDTFDSAQIFIAIMREFQGHFRAQ